MLCFLTAGLLAQGQYDLDPLPPFPDHVQYTHYSDQIGKGLVPPPPGSPHVHHQGLAPRCARHSWGPGGEGWWVSEGVVLGVAVPSCAPGGPGARLTPHNLAFISVLRQPGLL